MVEIVRIELDAGRLRETVIIDAGGRRPDYSQVGDLTFIVEAIELDGGRLCLWTGLRYDDAIRQADRHSRGFGLIPVVDLVAEGFEP